MIPLLSADSVSFLGCPRPAPEGRIPRAGGPNPRGHADRKCHADRAGGPHPRCPADPRQTLPRPGLKPPSTNDMQPG